MGRGLSSAAARGVVVGSVVLGAVYQAEGQGDSGFLRGKGRLRGVVQYLFEDGAFLAVDTGFDFRFEDPPDEIPVHFTGGLPSRASPSRASTATSAAWAGSTSPGPLPRRRRGI